MPRSSAPSFDDFWRIYPLHKAKGPAERAWKRLSASDRQKAVAAIPRYREYCRLTGVSIKYPQGWLNDRRWEDEYEEQAPPPLAGDAPAPSSPGDGMATW